MSKTVTILYTVKEEPIKEKTKKELNWYDPIKQEMQYFKGGKLVFEYKEDDYLIKMDKEERDKKKITNTFRLLPRIEDLEVYNYNNIRKSTNQIEIEKWFKNYLNYNNSEITVESDDRDGIEFKVPDEEIDDFIYQAERNNLRYTND
jgi:hypothetical protein